MAKSARGLSTCSPRSVTARVMRNALNIADLPPVGNFAPP
ncbi:hypothetical protein SEEMU129_01035 [Salmonella enterica subsp. enterica serovar Muenchen str. RKS4129]|nr:hypothetical protein SEEMU129_01035 [Salmonella enterica subsp. enterica serovar Muenchen str. RKS4129]ERH39697.1 hypothetical protein P381_06305 [Salmonella enterica subsp. enterica serovar Enteritidis str. 10-34587]